MSTVATTATPATVIAAHMGSSTQYIVANAPSTATPNHVINLTPPA